LAPVSGARALAVFCSSQDDLFEVVVDSAFVGTRKPEPEIYAITLERLGLPAEAIVLLTLDLIHHRDGEAPRLKRRPEAVPAPEAA